MKKIFFVFFIVFTLIFTGCGGEIPEEPVEPEIKEYNVTFEENGGEIVEDYEIRDGLLLSLPNISKSGFVFLGWYLDSEFKIKATEDIVVGSDLTLYARWELPTCTVKFVNTELPDIVVEKDSLITGLANPIKFGYVFSGWYKDIEFTKPWDFEQDIVFSDIKLYAKWEEEIVSYDYYIFDLNENGYTLKMYLGEKNDVIIPSSYNNKPVTSIECIFDWNVERISIPSSVININPDILNLWSLKHIEVACDNPNYKSIDGNLYSKDGTTLIKYASLKKQASFNVPEHVKTIGEYAFYYDGDLVEIKIPNSVSYIGEYAFAYCDSLFTINIPEGIDIIREGTFSNSGIVSIELPDTIKYIEYSAFGWCRRLKNIIIPKGVEKIYDYTFYNCNSLTSVVIPDTVTFIGEIAFEKCTNAKFYCESKVSNYSWANNWSYGRPIYFGCERINIRFEENGGKKLNPINTLKGSNIFLPNISKEGYLFGGWYLDNEFKNELDEYIIRVEEDTILYAKWNDISYGTRGLEYSSAGETYHVTGYEGYETDIVIAEKYKGLPVTCISASAFENFDSLTSILIPETIIQIGPSAFSGCSSLKEVYIPKSVEYIGRGAFSECESLEKVIFAEGIKEIDSYAFSRCTSLKKVYMPNSLNFIREYSFNGCTSLEEVVLSDNLMSIGDCAFSNCSFLKKIIIPRSVESIKYRAFDGCDSLKIYCEIEKKPFNWRDDWNPSNCPVEWNYNQNIE